MRPSSSTSLSVSTTGSAAHRAVAARAPRRPRGRSSSRHERARRIVDEHRRHLLGQVLETVRHALAARRARPSTRAADRRRTGRATAADRPRSDCGSTTTTMSHVGAGHEALHAVQQHRLPGHPPELLQLRRRRRACPARRRRSRRRRRATSPAPRRPAVCARRGGTRPGALTRTPAPEQRSTIARAHADRADPRQAARFGTPRSARYATVIPMFAASASRRSACDTGRISPPSPTSPRKTASCGSARS